MVGLHDHADGAAGHPCLNHAANGEYRAGITADDDQVAAGGLLQAEVASDRDELGHGRIQAGDSHCGHAIGDIDRCADRDSADGDAGRGVDVHAGVVVSDRNAGGRGTGKAVAQIELRRAGGLEGNLLVGLHDQAQGCVGHARLHHRAHAEQCARIAAGDDKIARGDIALEAEVASQRHELGDGRIQPGDGDGGDTIIHIDWRVYRDTADGHADRRVHIRAGVVVGDRDARGGRCGKPVTQIEACRARGLQRDLLIGLHQQAKGRIGHARLHHAADAEQRAGVVAGDDQVPARGFLEPEVTSEGDKACDLRIEAGDSNGSDTVVDHDRRADRHAADGNGGGRVDVRAGVVVDDGHTGSRGAGEAVAEIELRRPCGLQRDLLGGLDDQAEGSVADANLDHAAGIQRGAGVAAGDDEIAARGLLEAEVAGDGDELCDLCIEARDGDGGHTVRHVDRGADGRGADGHAEGLIDQRAGVVVGHAHASGGRRGEAVAQVQGRRARGLQRDLAAGLHDQADGAIAHACLHHTADIEHRAGIAAGDEQVSARALLEAEVTGQRDEASDLRIQAGADDGGHTVIHIDRGADLHTAHRNGGGRVHIGTGVVVGDGQACDGGAGEAAAQAEHCRAAGLQRDLLCGPLDDNANGAVADPHLDDSARFQHGRDLVPCQHQITAGLLEAEVTGDGDEAAHRGLHTHRRCGRGTILDLDRCADRRAADAYAEGRIDIRARVVVGDAHAGGRDTDEAAAQAEQGGAGGLQRHLAVGLDDQPQLRVGHACFQHRTRIQHGAGIAAGDNQIPARALLEAVIAGQRDEARDLRIEAGDCDAGDVVRHLDRGADAGRADLDGQCGVHRRAGVVVSDAHARRGRRGETCTQIQCGGTRGLQRDLLRRLDDQPEGRAGDTDLNDAADLKRGSSIVRCRDQVAARGLLEAEVAGQRDKVGDLRIQADDHHAGGAVGHIDRGAYASRRAGDRGSDIGTRVVKGDIDTRGRGRRKAAAQAQAGSAIRSLHGDFAIGLDDQAEGRASDAEFDHRAGFQCCTDVVTGGNQAACGVALEAHVAADRDKACNLCLQTGDDDGNGAMGHIDRRADRLGTRGHAQRFIHVRAGVVVTHRQCGRRGGGEARTQVEAGRAVRGLDGQSLVSLDNDSQRRAGDTDLDHAASREHCAHVGACDDQVAVRVLLQAEVAGDGDELADRRVQTGDSHTGDVVCHIDRRADTRSGSRDRGVHGSTGVVVADPHAGCGGGSKAAAQHQAGRAARGLQRDLAIRLDDQAEGRSSNTGLDHAADIERGADIVARCDQAAGCVLLEAHVTADRHEARDLRVETGHNHACGARGHIDRGADRRRARGHAQCLVNRGTGIVVAHGDGRRGGGGETCPQVQVERAIGSLQREFLVWLDQQPERRSRHADLNRTADVERSTHIVADDHKVAARIFLEAKVTSDRDKVRDGRIQADDGHTGHAIQHIDRRANARRRASDRGVHIGPRVVVTHAHAGRGGRGKATAEDESGGATGGLQGNLVIAGDDQAKGRSGHARLNDGPNFQRRAHIVARGNEATRGILLESHVAADRDEARDLRVEPGDHHGDRAIGHIDRRADGGRSCGHAQRLVDVRAGVVVAHRQRGGGRRGEAAAEVKGGRAIRGLEGDLLVGLDQHA